MKSERYKLSLEQIEKRSLTGERFKTIFNMHRIEKTKQLHDRLDRYSKQKYSLKRKKLKDNLNIGEKVLVLPERIKKKSAPENFYKQSVRNISYFNKEKTFVTRKKQKINKITCYWLRDIQIKRKVSKRFQRTELFAMKGKKLYFIVIIYGNKMLNVLFMVEMYQFIYKSFFDKNPYFKKFSIQSQKVF